MMNAPQPSPASNSRKIFQVARYLFGAIIVVVVALSLAKLAHRATPPSRLESANEVLLQTVQTAPQGDADKVNVLIAHGGADPNAIDSDGKSALLLAAEAGQIKVVEVLLSHGADPARADRHGLIPLRAAAVNGHNEIVQLLMLREQKGSGQSAK